MNPYADLLFALNQNNQDWDIKPPQGAAGTQSKICHDRSLRTCGALRRFDYLY